MKAFSPLSPLQRFCYSDVVGIIAPKSPFVKPSKEKLSNLLWGLMEILGADLQGSGLCFFDSVFSFSGSGEQKRKNFKKIEKNLGRALIFSEKNRL
ncbi:MAG: hypothetical protein IJX59_05225 [Clostridia bacterium]|nr:hypothetical protein [Clostridia bacterium]